MATQDYNGSLPSAKRVEALITQIGTAFEAGAVTNEMVAEILDALYQYVTDARRRAESGADDVSALRTELDALNARVRRAIDDDMSDRIDSLNEVLRFLEGVADSESLAATLDTLASDISRLEGAMPRSVVLSEAEYERLAEAGEVNDDTFYYLHDD